MSSATPSPFERDYCVYLEDMLEFSGSVIEYTAGHTFETWAADAMRLDATLRKLSLIGEAATKVPAAIRDQAPDIPWRQIVGARNRLMHVYPSTDLSAIWSIVSINVPVLRPALQAPLSRL